MKYDLLLDYPNSTDPNLIKILNETNEIFRSKYMEDTLHPGDNHTDFVHSFLGPIQSKNSFFAIADG